jgi:type I restriction enzyme R subunit
VQKIPNNQPLTEYDLAELERLLLQAGIATIDNLTQAKAASERFALFIRALVGMDRAAAKAAFDKFLTNKLPSANQIQFINHIIDHLTGQGYMKPECLYESPFTDLHPKGVDGLFASNEVDDLVATLRSIRTSAAAA